MASSLSHPVEALALRDKIAGWLVDQLEADTRVKVQYEPIEEVARDLAEELIRSRWIEDYPSTADEVFS